MTFTLAVIKFSDGLNFVEICMSKHAAEDFIDQFADEYGKTHDNSHPNIIADEIIPDVTVNDAPFEHLFCVANSPKELLGLN